MLHLAFTLALTFTSAPARATTFGQFCARWLSLEHVSRFRSARAARRITKASSYGELITLRYVMHARGLRWTWQPARNSLKVTFAANRREYNDTLLAVASFLALAYDGREYYLRDSEGAPTRKRSRPTLRLALEAEGSRGMVDFAKHATEAERALVDLATLEVTNSPVREPTVHLYEGFDQLLHQADRYAFLMAQPAFTWLELRTTPAELRDLRRRVRRRLWDHR